MLGDVIMRLSREGKAGFKLPVVLCRIGSSHMSDTISIRWSSMCVTSCGNVDARTPPPLCKMDCCWWSKAAVEQCIIDLSRDLWLSRNCLRGMR